jgi:hypothetical protein
MFTRQGTSEAARFFGSDTLNGQGFDDIFIAKYDSTGQLIWARQMGGPGWESGRSVAVDSDGSCYITGFYDGPAPFNTLPVQSQDKDLFLLKFDPNGHLLWAQTAGGPGYELGWEVICDGNGQVFVSADYSDGLILNGNPVNNQGGTDVLLAHYDAQGTLVDYRLVNSFNVDVGYEIILDGKSRGYLVGAYTGTGTFGSHVLPGNGSQDGYVAAFTHINTTGIFAPPPLPRLLVFPNPSTGQFSLGQSFPPGSRIQVCNSLGQRLVSKELSLPNPQLNISGPPGVYHLLITNPEGKILGQEKVLVK